MSCHHLKYSWYRSQPSHYSKPVTNAVQGRLPITAAETERLVRAGLEPARREVVRSVGRPQKHVRIATKFGMVQLTPADPHFNDETLLAMLREARREISVAEFPEK